MAQEIFVQTSKGTSGPFGSKQIRQMAANGQLRADDLISFDGTKWGVASGLKGLEFQAPEDDTSGIDLAKAAEKAGKSMLSTLKGAAGVVSSSVSNTVVKIQAERQLAKSQPPALPAPGPSLIQRFINEDQDPKILESTVPRIQQFLTSNEELLYIAIQKKPVANIAPDCIAMTSRRIIFFTIKLLGQLSFNDHLWRNVANATIKEGLLGATFSATVTNGQFISIDYLPKAQARMLYRYAQEMEENAIEERRNRSMEESRAAAGGVVVQNAFVPPTAAAPASPADDPLASLQKLKSMLDAGLISPEEFAAKKSEILSRM